MAAPGLRQFLATAVPLSFFLMPLAAFPAGCAAGAGTGPPVGEVSQPVERGRIIAAAHCAACHAISEVGDSPVVDAPALRDLGRRFPVRDLLGALAEGAMPSHPAMPPFRLSFEDGQALIAYVESLQR